MGPLGMYAGWRQMQQVTAVWAGVSVIMTVAGIFRFGCAGRSLRGGVSFFGSGLTACQHEAQAQSI